MSHHLSNAALIRRLSLLAWVALATTWCGSLVGCGGPRNKPTDAVAARLALTTTLDAWKSGGKPQELKDRDPSMIVRDPDWLAGKRLVSYQIAKETDVGVRMHCTVDLVVAGEHGEEPSHVSYVVGTHPVITVFREE